MFCKYKNMYYICIYLQTKIGNMFEKPISIRSRIINLRVNDYIKFVGTRQVNTQRNYAATIGSLTGRKYRVMKQGDTSVTVYRYE